MKTPLTIIFILVAALARVPAARQTPTGGVEHFSKDGLSFDYPAGWSLEDRSTAELQHLVLRRPDSSVLVMVVAHREVLQSAGQALGARATITRPYVENVARRLGAPPPEGPVSHCLPVGDGLAMGYRMAGRLGQEPSTGEVYAVLLGQRLVHLVYVRADKEGGAGEAAWKAVTETLKVEPPANPSPDASKMARVITGGVLNGKVTSKPLPDYPRPAKKARASGTVAVQVLVDEQGEVVEARAVSGHSLLQAAAVEAARRAKFSPTLLCGKPVRVSGVITYNFVLNF